MCSHSHRSWWLTEVTSGQQGLGRGAGKDVSKGLKTLPWLELSGSVRGDGSIAWRLLRSRNAALSFSSYRPTAGKPGLVGDVDALQQNKFVLIAVVDGKQGANLASWTGEKSGLRIQLRHQEDNEGAVACPAEGCVSSPGVCTEREQPRIIFRVCWIRMQ